MLACLPLTCRSNRTDAERFLPVAANTPAVDVHGQICELAQPMRDPCVDLVVDSFYVETLGSESRRE